MNKSLEITLRLIDKMTGPLKHMTGDVQNFDQAVNAAQSRLDKMAQAQATLDKTLSRSANMTMVGAGAMAMGNKLTNALQAPLDVAMEFEKTMTKVQALTRLDMGDAGQRKKMEALREQAKLLGDTTSFSASEAAGAQAFLAMAGFDPDKIMQSMPGMLSLAKAGGTELQRTADIASNVLSGFGMTADQMGRLGDVMSYTFSSSNVDLEMLGNTMKYVAPIASKAGASLEQVAAMSGMLGDVGIQGDMAGTALRAAFIRLADPPKEARKALAALGVETLDAKNNVRSITDILGDLDNTTKKLGSGEKLEYISSIFGAEAAAAMMELVSNSSKLDSRFRDIEKSAGGAADKIAGVMGNNLAGRKDEMLSALEGLYITIGDLLTPTVQASYEKITQIIRAVQAWTLQNKGLVQTVVTVAAKVGSAVSAFGAVAIAAGTVLSSFGMLRYGLTAVGVQFTVLRLAVLGIGAGVAAAVKHWDSVLPWIKNHFPALGNWLGNVIPAATSRFKAAWAALQGVWNGATWWGDSRLEQFRQILMIAFGVDVIGRFQGALSQLQQQWQALMTRLTPVALQFKAVVLQAFGQLQDGIGDGMRIASGLIEQHGATMLVVAGVMAGGFLGLLATLPSRMALIGKGVGGVWQTLSTTVAPHLITLKNNITTVFGAIGSWASANAGKIRGVLQDILVGGLRKVGQAFAWLSARASDGSIGRWLDVLLVKIKPFLAGLASAFAWLASIGARVAGALGYLARFVGGWDVLGKVLIGVFAGGWLISAMSGFVQGLVAIGTVIGFLLSPVGLLVALMAGMAIGARYLYLEWDNLSFAAKAVGVTLLAIGAAIVGAVAVLKIMAIWTAAVAAATSAWSAALMVAKGVMLVLRAVALVGFLMAWATASGVAAVATWAFGGALAFLTSPITLIIAAVVALAAGAYYLYTNWQQVSAYLSETTWGQMLLGVINAVIHPLDTLQNFAGWLGEKWNNTKAGLMETTWGQMLIGVITALFSPFESFKSSMELMGNIWGAVKAKLADTSWGQAIISTVNAVKSAISGIGNAIDSAKAAVSAKASSAWASAKSFVGLGGGGGVDGARATGGPVKPGGFYRVNELGPELLSMNGATYLMASAAGQVSPLISKMPGMLSVANDSPFGRMLPKTAGNLALAEQPEERQRPNLHLVNSQPAGNAVQMGNIQITVNPSPGMDETMLAEMVESRLRDLMRNMGNRDSALYDLE